MARKKMITYMDENLLRSAKILAAKRDVKIYEVFEDALRRYLEKADWPDWSGTSREEPRDYGAHEWEPRQRIPLLFGGQDPTLGERFEEELYPS
jgi:hypothetical protein